MSSQGFADVIDRAGHYRSRAHRKARAHYLAGKRAASLHLRLGVPAVLTSTIVGTTIFGTLSTEPELGWKIATGLLSIAAAVLAALQTFFRHAEEAEKHRSAAAAYAELDRGFDLYLLKHRTVGSAERTTALEDLQQLLDRFDELEKASLDVPDRMYDQAVREEGREAQGAQ